MKQRPHLQKVKTKNLRQKNPCSTFLTDVVVHEKLMIILFSFWPNEFQCSSEFFIIKKKKKSKLAMGSPPPPKCYEKCSQKYNTLHLYCSGKTTKNKWKIACKYLTLVSHLFTHTHTHIKLTRLKISFTIIYFSCKRVISLLQTQFVAKKS